MSIVFDNRELVLGEAAGLAPLPVFRVAIADDDPDSLELLRVALESPMTEIYEATNGVELVQLLVDSGPFDLVITDVLMPWIEGLQVLRSARLAEISTPVLVVSGLTRPELQTVVDAIGNAALLHKPLGIPDLRAAISDLMSRQFLS
jgi:two-component system cell cycle response regulator CtrA